MAEYNQLAIRYGNQFIDLHLKLGLLGKVGIKEIPLSTIVRLKTIRQKRAYNQRISRFTFRSIFLPFQRASKNIEISVRNQKHSKNLVQHI